MKNNKPTFFPDEIDTEPRGDFDSSFFLTIEIAIWSLVAVGVIGLLIYNL